MSEWLMAMGGQIGPILLTFLGLTLLIAFHELGHLLAAKLTGMAVSTYSIGFGPVLFRKRIGEVEFRFCPILLGGYVRILGMTGIPQIDDGEAARLKAEGRTDDEIARLCDKSRWYWNKSGWAQLLVIGCGPLFSFILGFLLLSASVGIYGQSSLTEPLTVAAVQPDSLASEGGIKEGDQILTVNGFPTKSLEDLRKNMSAGDPSMVLVDVKRGEENVSLVLKPQEGKQLSLGIQLAVVTTEVAPIEAIKRGAETTLAMIYLQADGLIGLVTGKTGSGDLAGPVGIIAIGAQSAADMQTMLFFVAVLSIALGVFNLVPFPPLDGGRMVFAAIKAFTGRSVSAAVQSGITALGTIALLILIFITLFLDAGRF